MGKTHIVETNQEEAVKEKEKVEEAVKKSASVKPSAGKITEGRAYIFSSYNNTIITLADGRGSVLASKSAGAVGFKGTKKSTSFAASRVAETIANICKKLSIEKLDVFVKGMGAGRESAVRTLANQGLNIASIKDITPVPHNGCSPKKPRRV